MLGITNGITGRIGNIQSTTPGGVPMPKARVFIGNSF